MTPNGDAAPINTQPIKPVPGRVGPSGNPGRYLPNLSFSANMLVSRVRTYDFDHQGQGSTYRS